MARYERLSKALDHVVRDHGPIDGRTRVLKLIFLSDREWYQTKGDGHVYTEARYYRWNHGPFSREVLSSLEWLNGIEVLQEKVSAENGEMYRYRAGSQSRLHNAPLDAHFAKILDRTAAKWKNAPLNALLRYVYALPDFKKADFGDPLLEERKG